MKQYDWDVVLLREVPGPDGRVSPSAFIGSYRLNSTPLDNAMGWIRSLPLGDAVWIGITRLEAS